LAFVSIKAFALIQSAAASIHWMNSASSKAKSWTSKKPSSIWDGFLLVVCPSAQDGFAFSF
jgi:hypothetical protein